GLPVPVAAYEVEWEPLEASPPVPAATYEAAGADGQPERVLPNRLRRFPPFGFFGRDVEQTALAGAWKEALTGRGQLVLLSGEPGIGKTALTAELARHVHADGALVLYGRCDQDLGVPYQPFVEALRDFPVEEAAPPAALREWARVHAGALLPLLPELVAR